MHLLLGIDLGSTSLKAIVYDLDGRAVARGSRPTKNFHPSAQHPDGRFGNRNRFGVARRKRYARRSARWTARGGFAR